MGKKAKTSSGKRKALERKIDRTTLPPPPPNPEDEVRFLNIFRIDSSVQDGVTIMMCNAYLLLFVRPILTSFNEHI
jgi:hypothetical protein